jgi:RNA recognition motif-containing protein
MADDEAAKKAIAELNGSMVDGRPIKVNEAKPKPGKDFGGGGGGERNFNNPKSYNQTRY